jgi:hypothetical protein
MMEFTVALRESVVGPVATNRGAAKLWSLIES